jgi:hypothetical protein
MGHEEWFDGWWWRLAWGRYRPGKCARLVFRAPVSTVPGVPWERFEYRYLAMGLWWRRKGEG